MTKPTQGMRQAMANADVGDDVYGEDPTVIALEATAARLLGHEAALFCVTGSMANLLGVWLNTPVGGEVLCDERAHIVRAELGAHAAYHGVTSRTWSSPDGVARLSQIAAMVSEASPHLVPTRAIEIENTMNFASGVIQPLDEVRLISGFCHDRGLGLHLDGARLANACVATGVPLADYGRLATTVTLCLSKGLGAPMGSILASSGANIARARVERKRLGGGWRQAGVLAAAGLYALDHHYNRLSQDHRAASAMGEEIRARAPWAIAAGVATNIVVVRTGSLSAAEVVSRAGGQGLKLSAVGSHEVRAVAHLDVTYDDCVEAGRILGAILSGARP